MNALDVSPYLRLTPRAEAEVREDTAALLAMAKAPKLAYCDYIANRIKGALSCFDPERIIGKVGHVNSDLHPVGGYLLTTQKTIEVTGTNGNRYLVTVEEIAHETPCRLPPSECKVCEDREWHDAHARDAAED